MRAPENINVDNPIEGIARGEPDPADPFGITAILPFGDPWSCTYDAATGTWSL